MRTSLLTRLFDVISPRTCAICGGRLSINESVICAVCHLHLPLTRYEQSPLDNHMVRLFWGHFPVEKASALFYYEPQSDCSKLIYDMKYHSRPEIGEAMGEIAAKQFTAEGFFKGIDALIPVPITWRRQWHRGYNQSLEIARGVSAVTGISVLDNVVRRTQFNGSQTNKHAWERMNNVEGAFRLKRPERIVGRHILLIDDIVTTGATIIACAQELAKAKDVRISILSLGITKS